jgi:pimeloyl-ACP methyl ester carboxylesterase
VNKPILYVVGERDVAYTKVAQSLMRAWAENHESALLERGFVQVSVIPQVGHNAHLEAPEEFGLLVQRFLAQRPCSCATC